MEKYRVNFRRLENKTALITGASRGIGKAIAYELSSYGVRLALLARTEEELDKVYRDLSRNNNDVLVLKTDLRDTDAIMSAIEDCKSTFSTVDFLINNAGLGIRSLWEDISLECELDITSVNYIAPVVLINNLLPDMLANKSGHIVNINSLAGVYAAPYQAAYTASKFALSAYASSLAYELENTGVHISSIYLGPTDTDFITIGHDKEWLENNPKDKLNKPEDVAKIVTSVLLDPKETATVGMRMLLFLGRLTNLSPRFFRNIIERRHRPPTKRAK